MCVSYLFFALTAKCDLGYLSFVNQLTLGKVMGYLSSITGDKNLARWHFVSRNVKVFSPKLIASLRVSLSLRKFKFEVHDTVKS